METCPKVSIALATYNGEQFIAKQIDSLLLQDYPNLEIVISDDCSTDGTWDILRAYVSRDSRIRLLRVRRIWVMCKILSVSFNHVKAN